MGKVSGLRRGIGALFGIGLGGMLLVAALLKAADPALFVVQIRGYGIFPELSELAAYVFVVIEVTIAVFLILQLTPRWSLLAFGALMVVFIGATAWTWAHGNTSGCGCFGRLSSRSPAEVIVEDAIYLALAAVAFWGSPWVSRVRVRGVVAVVLLLPLAASPWIVPHLPVDSWVTPLRPGYSIENLAVDDLRTPLSDGRLLVAFLGPDCPPCSETLPALNSVARTRRDEVRVVGIFAGDRRETRAWVMEQVPAFPMAHASERSLRQYYRRLPVVLLVDEGIVRQIWWKGFTDPDLLPPPPAGREG